jgi:hypothetical protein
LANITAAGGQKHEVLPLTCQFGDLLIIAEDLTPKALAIAFRPNIFWAAFLAPRTFSSTAFIKSK